MTKNSFLEKLNEGKVKKNVRSLVGLIFLVGIIDLSNAKCSFFPMVTAEIEFDQCQTVKFDSSISKIDWFPGLPPTYIQDQGESISGTLVVGKILSSGFEQKSSKFSIPYSWKKGKMITLFFVEKAKDICPELFPGKIKVKPSGRCCDVLPYRGECIIPQTIHVVNKVDSK